MQLTTKQVKWIVPLSVFSLFCLGRIVNLFFIKHFSFFSVLAPAVFYSLSLMSISVYIIDLIYLQGYLQYKVLFVKILSCYCLITFLINYLIKIDTHSYMLGLYLLETVLLLILFLVLVFINFHMSNHQKLYNYNPTENLPNKYLKFQPVQFIINYFLRLLPYPEPIGLYKIGNPTSSSLVYITGNYNLSIRKIVKFIKGYNCWLLVCNSRGMDIWSSAMAGYFGTNDIIEAIQLTGLKNKVDHNRLILPQTCASNISVSLIKCETDFIAEFGPISPCHIAVYLKNPKDLSLRHLNFNAIERVELAFGLPLMIIIILFFIYNFFNLPLFSLIVPILYLLSFLLVLIYPYRFFKNQAVWTIFCSLTVFIILAAFNLFILKSLNIIFILTISLALSYMIIEFENWVPLKKQKQSVFKKIYIEIDLDLCIGCGRCLEVCPKAVYKPENKKVAVNHLNECIACRACFTQCPLNAINHSANITFKNKLLHK